MTVRSERRGAILVVTLDREGKRNAIDRAMSLGIESALDLLEDDPTLRVGIVTGVRSVFSAGSDLGNAPGATMTDRGGEYGLARRRRTKPLVAAVEGLAYGGGFELALACDVIVAASDARFALPEALRGVVAASGGLFRAPRAVPLNVAKEMLLTGAPVDAQRLHALGVVNRLARTGEALDEAIDLAEEICRSSPAAVRATLAALEEIAGHHDPEFWQVTEQALASVRRGPDEQEGIRAFFEKRPPSWTPIGGDSGSDVSPTSDGRHG